jgi:hypothetical protein
MQWPKEKGQKRQTIVDKTVIQSKRNETGKLRNRWHFS